MFIDFRERGRGKERETSMWERNINQLPLVHIPTRDQIQYLGMCPDRESNQRPFGLGDDVLTN